VSRKSRKGDVDLLEGFSLDSVLSGEVRDQEAFVPESQSARKALVDIPTQSNLTTFNGNQQSPSVTSANTFNGNQQSPSVTRNVTKTSLTVTNSNPLTVINGNQKRWREAFCLPLKFFNDTQPNNVALRTNNQTIAAKIGLANGTVKNAMSILTSLGFLENVGGRSGRWRPEVRRQITPLGYALMASDYFRTAIERLDHLTVTNGNQQSPLNGNQRSPLTDRQNLNSVSQSEEWLAIANAGGIPGMTPETLSDDLLAKRPDRWTPDVFSEQVRIWAHRKRTDKVWFSRIKKSEWKTFVAEMLDRGGIDPRPGYKSCVDVQAVAVPAAIASAPKDPEIERCEAEARTAADRIWDEKYDGNKDVILELIPTALRGQYASFETSRLSSVAKGILLSQIKQEMGIE
jgi:hypothetical protein